MVMAGDFRKGTTVEIDGKIYPMKDCDFPIFSMLSPARARPSSVPASRTR